MPTTTLSPVTISSDVSKKTRRTPAQWQHIISDYQSSGLTQREFCTQRGVAYSSFTHWLIKFKKTSPVKHDEIKPMPLFAKVTQDAVQFTSSDSWDAELEFANGMVLRLKQN